MTQGEFRTLDTRHDAKMKPVGGNPHPGDERDQRLPLSYAGMKHSYEVGQNPEIVPPNFDIVVVDRSTLVRTTLTAMQMLAGAGYNPDNEEEVTWKPEDERIGLANGMNFGHDVLPAYSPVNPGADNYVAGLLRNCWVPVEGGEIEQRPVGSQLAYALLDNRIKAVTEHLAAVKDGAKVLHLQATHAPYIDTLDAALFGTVQVEDGHVTLDNKTWPGHYAMGTFIKGRMLEGRTADNPVFEFDGIPDRHDLTGSTRVVVHSLDEMKVLRDGLYKLSEGKS
jgi:hypothetical protein